MQICRGYDTIPPSLKGCVLAIGNFDGVHRGHQAVIGATVAEARRRGVKAGVMVFEPHPRQYFKPDLARFELTPLARKQQLFESLGVDLTAVLDFNAELASLEADMFVEQVLVAGFGVGHVVIGYDFYFGKGRGGTPETMQALGEKHSFGVSIVAPAADDGRVFSSSEIRKMLAKADVRGAALVLGHWWQVSGEITHGAQIGASLGFPTANITLPAGTALAHGIYAARIFVDQETYDGAAYLGTRPTVDDGAPALEVFLFDFDGDLYGRTIDVAFIDYVRPDMRFADMESLKVQIAKDCEVAADLLAQADRERPLAHFPLGAS